MTDVTALFCSIDDFWTDFENRMSTSEGQVKRLGTYSVRRISGMCMSEVMTIVILFHIQGYRNFKNFYTQHVMKHLRGKFPGLTSYTRFVELMQGAVFPLHCYLMSRLGDCSGISFVDSTPLKTCHLKRVHSHKVFEKIAKWGKTSVGFFFGFKLHIIVNDQGELLAFMVTPGNVDDRKPIPDMIKGLFGKLFGDKGYLSKELFDSLLDQGIQLVTKLRKGMKNKLMSFLDRLLLRKRGVIESVIDQLKNISQIEHSRHRSPVNFVVNLLSGLIAYTLQPKKPKIMLTPEEEAFLSLEHVVV